jgi:hydrogenase nickel incorporation protein HypB
MFRVSSAMLINKIDLLEHTNFSMDEAKSNASGINPKLNIFPLSCTAGDGLDAWTGWLESELEKKRSK